MRRECTNEELVCLLLEGNYSQAVSRCRELLDQLQPTPGDSQCEFLILMDFLCDVCIRMRDYPGAIELLQRLLEYDNPRSGEVCAEYTRDLCNLGFVFRRMGRVAEAEDAFRRSLDLIDELPLDEQWVRSAVLINLARIFTDRDEHTEAHRLLLRAAIERLQLQHPRTGVALHLLACAYWHGGKQQIANRVFGKARRVFEWSRQTEHSDFAAFLCSLGRIDEKAGNTAGARENFTQALNIYRRVRPPEPEGVEYAEARLRKLDNISEPLSPPARTII